MPVLCIPCIKRYPLPIWIARTNEKAGDGMEGSQNVIRVDKSKCIRVIHSWESQAIKLADNPPILNRQCINRFKPSYPEEFHATSSIIQHPAPCVDDVDVKYSNNMRISIRVNVTVTGISSKQHNVSAVCLGIDDILSMPHVVCHVIDSQNVMLVQSIVLEV
jgi:hypothetical protein